VAQKDLKAYRVCLVMLVRKGLVALKADAAKMGSEDHRDCKALLALRASEEKQA
jgi:hypothetical protein